MVQARWARAQADRARDTLNRAMNGVNAYQTAETVSTQGQPLLTMRVVRVTAQLLVILDGRCRRRREADAVAKRLGCQKSATGLTRPDAGS